MSRFAKLADEQISNMVTDLYNRKIVETSEREADNDIIVNNPNGQEEEDSTLRGIT